MTRLPWRDPELRPADLPEYELNIVCAAPGCDQPSQDPHHLFRRSALGGAFPWVELPSIGWIVGNTIGLCRVHHDLIESGGAWINLSVADETPVFEWGSLFNGQQQLVWQPPMLTLGEADVPDPTASASPSVGSPPEETRAEEGSPGAARGPTLDQRADGVCPSCKRPLPHPKLDNPREEKRPRRTWSVTVPVDERENGAELLTTLLEESRLALARAGMAYGEENTAKYFVLAAALGLFVQHAQEVFADA